MSVYSADRSSERRLADDLASEAVLVDPYPWYEEAREIDGAIETAAGFVVTRTEHVIAVLRDTKRFSSRMGARTGTQWGDQPTDEMKAIMASGFPEVSTLTTNDPPSHHHFKSLASRAFSPSVVRSLERSITQTASTLIDQFCDAGAVDLVSQFAIPFPLLVIADALGIPQDRLDDYKRWTDSSVRPLTEGLTPEDRAECMRGRVEAQRFMMNEIQRRRVQPGGDLISSLVTAEEEGRRLEDLEVLSITLSILVAGNESSRNTLANGMSILASNPALQERLRQDPDLVTPFVEDLLRVESPVQFVNRRTTEDVQLGSTRIPEGSRVLVGVAAVNRDPGRCPHAEMIDVDRVDVGRHLAFGQGIHFCLGAPLSRAEFNIGFRQLLSRLVNIRVDNSRPPARRVPHLTLRGLHELYLRFEPAG